MISGWLCRQPCAVNSTGITAPAMPLNRRHCPNLSLLLWQHTQPLQSLQFCCSGAPRKRAAVYDMRQGGNARCSRLGHGPGVAMMCCVYEKRRRRAPSGVGFRCCMLCGIAAPGQSPIQYHEWSSLSVAADLRACCVPRALSAANSSAPRLCWLPAAACLGGLCLPSCEKV